MSELTVAPSPPAHDRDSRWRRVGRVFLLIVFCLSTVLSMVSIWMRNQIDDTDRYVDTVAPLASDPVLQDAVAGAVSSRLGAWLNENLSTRDLLIDRQQLLAAPLTAALVGFVDDTVYDYVSSDQFPPQWEQINRAAHPAVSAVLTGDDTERLVVEDGQVALDLAPLITAVVDQLRARGIDVFDRLQLDQIDTTFVIFESDDLASIQRLVELLEAAAIVLPIVALVALAGYVVLSRDRRRAIIVAGVGLAVAMALLLLLLAVARWRFLDRLDPDANRAAVTAFFDIIGRNLRDAARLLVVVGVVVAALAAVTRPGSRVRQGPAAAGNWLGSTWGDANSRWPQVQDTGSWVERHRRDLVLAIVAVCCLVLILRDHVTSGLALTALVVAIAAFAAMLLVTRDAPQLVPAGAAAAPVAAPGARPVAAVVSPAPAVTAEAPALGVQERQRVAESSARASLIAISGELPEEDVNVLRRLAVLLRDAP